MGSRSNEVLWEAPRLERPYRRVFIVDSRQTFATVRGAYEPATDLVLTYDFGLCHEIEAVGGSVYYVDRLVDPAVMQENNQLLYAFFQSWNRDEAGADIFEHAGVSFGFAFRLEFWNDFVFYARTWLCLERVTRLTYEELYVGTAIGIAERILGERGIAYSAIVADHAGTAYFFPIHAWMNANIRHGGAKAAALRVAARIIGNGRRALDLVTRAKRQPAVFLQEYHPTAPIAERLREERRVRLVVAGPTRARPFARVVPMPRLSQQHRRTGERLMCEFGARRSAKLVLSTGADVSSGVYRIIDERIGPQAAQAVRMVEGSIRQLARDPFRLIVLIANIGDTVTIVDCACRPRGIPSYLIINGLLATKFGDDSKHATTINSYSPSIRDHYFRGMDNVVCLGDPRMDAYPPTPRRSVDPDRFTVTIGAAGFNSTDLNSHVAVEFEFMHGVLSAVRRVKERYPRLRVIIKVRANGYLEQYVAFAREYFPDIVDEITQTEAIATILDRTDFYISIYSQTLFEASCKGIPVLYYQVADYYKYPPFDGESELVTARTVGDVEAALMDARLGHSRFDAFLDRDVMAKYVGPLDGGNVDRNVGYIYDLVESAATSTVA